MFSWATRRKLLFALAALLFLGAAVGLPAFFLFYTAPTCSDGKQNGNETGIDCGGSCTILCTADTLAPLIHWVRISPVGKGFWNALAYVENPNFESGAFETPYRLELYDRENALVAEERGFVAIPPRTAFGVFRGSVGTGERTPVRALFEFIREPVWKHVVTFPAEVSVTAKELVSPESAPKLIVTFTNRSLADITNLEAVAILYDRSENVVGFSRTVIDLLPKDGLREAVFTWPAPFTRPVTRIEVLSNAFDPRLNLGQ
ncbi:MAG: Uncharacterized protein G01um101472_161 [Parcubacteria group bacterium Gr01-1014_72]|nr:MAG: Uncharacterized protein G01um101472_161 [Parcubacteria group bacterium Gr01-1014_72]